MDLWFANVEILTAEEKIYTNNSS